ncbi:MAG: protein kinase [Acidobacteria bacterium]|nr:protein kinase [Acidobacteriota bacterium]
MADKSDKKKQRKTLSIPALNLKKNNQIEEGSIVGKKYRLEKVLGVGGMGTVYLAEDIKLGRKVAIKTISEAVSKDRELRKRLLREAKTLSRIEHPNICTVYEIAEEKNHDYIVMQYIAGNTLSDIPPNLLSWEQKVEIIYQIAQALGSAHSASIIHRDIKPSNIKFDTSGYLKVLDFGLAKEIDKDNNLLTSSEDETLPIEDFSAKWKSALTHEGTILGTVYYMSPEQARGENLDVRTDIFSLGTLMYELATGKLPFPESDTISALYHIVNTPPLKLGKMMAGVPRRLQKIIYKSLEKRREDRYQSIDEMLVELEKLRTEIIVNNSARVASELREIAVKDMEKLKEKRDSSSKPISQISSAITTVRRTLKGGKKLLVWAVALAAIIVALFQTGVLENLLSSVIHQEEVKPSIVVVSKFESNELESEIGDVVQFLIIRSLSQMKSVWFIDNATLAEIQNKLGITTEMNNANLKILNKHEGLMGVIEGKLDSLGDKKMVEVAPVITHLINGEDSIRAENIRLDITPGQGQDSILLRIIDEIREEVSDKLDLVSPEDEIKGITFITTDSWDALLAFMKAEKMWAKRKIAEAQFYLKRALKNDEFFALALGRYGEIEKFLGNKITALDTLKKALELSSKLTYADRLYFASLTAELEMNYDKQMELLKELYAFRPLDWNTSFALAEAYFHRGMIPEARKIYEDTLVLSPSFAQALNHYGYCLSYLGEHDAAIEALKKYKSLDQTYNAYDSLGDGYFYAGDYEKAIRYKMAALSENPDIDWIHRSLADFYILLGQTNDALKANDNFKRSAGTNKQSLAEAAMQRGYIYLLIGKRLEAKVEIDKAQELYGEKEIFRFIDELPWLRGLWYLEAADTENARKELEWYEFVINKYGINSNKYFTFYKYYLHLKALCEYHEGRTEDARETFRHLVELGPKLGYWITMHHQGYFLTESARIEYEMSNYDEAISLLHEALNYSPNYPNALFYLGKVYLAKGDMDEGRKTLRQYLSVCKDADKDFPMTNDAKKLLVR